VKWIRVDDQLPPLGQIVLGYWAQVSWHPFSILYLQDATKDRRVWLARDNPRQPVAEPTHWLAIELPEERPRPILELEEEERQAVLLALAALAVERPGWDDMLNRVALRIDNAVSGRAQMYDQFRCLRAGREPPKENA
jgi:hypothetical protein